MFKKTPVPTEKLDKYIHGFKETPAKDGFTITATGQHIGTHVSNKSDHRLFTTNKIKDVQ